MLRIRILKAQICVLGLGLSLVECLLERSWVSPAGEEDEELGGGARIVLSRLAGDLGGGVSTPVATPYCVGNSSRDMTSVAPMIAFR